MKVIFLDIDGVLNSEATPNPRRFPYVVDPDSVVILKSVLEQTDAKVVLSSTWRVDAVGLLAAKHFGISFVDATPDEPSAPRCGEISRWLYEHPEVRRYAVIDDSDDCLDELPLFQPSPKTGINRAIADGLVAFLNGESDHDMRQPALVRMEQQISGFFDRDKS
jgi:hypothetical protein